MNKYSQKITNFIDEKIKVDLEININHNNLLIKEIIQIAKAAIELKLNYSDYNISYIDKLHDDKNYPIIYHLFTPYYKNFTDFLNWYIIKQQLINFNDYSLKNNKYYQLIFNPDISRKELHDILYNNNFISIDICHYFEINDIIKVNIDNDIFNLNLYVAKQDEEQINYYLEKIIRVIIFMYNINTSLINKKKQKINANVLISHQRKEIGKLELLSPININSGSAIRNNIITVWREEEIEKVLIHEIQHYYSCDFHIETLNYNYVKDIINKYFTVDGVDMVNESYNETLAHIINMCYQSCKLNISINKIYDYEITFLLFQTAKIIKLFGGTSVFNTIFKQTTSVLSYYVIKTFLLFNVNNTIDLINNFELKCVDDNIKLYGDYVDKILKETKIKDYINKMLEILNNLDDCFISRTLRMTAIE